MEPLEKFVCFLQFHNFADIGFYTEDLRIETCPVFAYLTRTDDKSHFDGNRMNILLIDPFCSHVQGALFRSFTNYDNEIIN